MLRAVTLMRYNATDDENEESESVREVCEALDILNPEESDSVEEGPGPVCPFDLEISHPPPVAVDSLTDSRPARSVPISSTQEPINAAAPEPSSFSFTTILGDRERESLVINLDSDEEDLAGEDESGVVPHREGAIQGNQFPDS